MTDAMLHYTPDTFDSVGYWRRRWSFRSSGRHSLARVFSNEQTTVSIAAGYTRDVDLTAAKMPELKASMEAAYEQSIPRLEWIVRGYKEINGKRWIHLELESEAVDTRIRNIVLMTAMDNGLVIFNFNGTVEDYETYRGTLEQSWMSIQVQKSG